MPLPLKTTPRKNERPRSQVLRLVISQFQRFVKLESSEGILLLICTVIALLWANSVWSDSYQHVWHTELSIGFGEVSTSRSLVHWINDGLMVIFFFVVGMEIKRQIVIGELSSLKKASLPVIAALGGMLVPAIMYGMVNKGSAGAGGWGIPMATDIAFSLGILALLGKRIPLQLKVFLMAFAIADDIGAVIVIALFYASGIAWTHLLTAGFILLLLIASNKLGIRSVSVYAILGFLLWMAFLDSGIHATVAGVLLAMTIPSRSNLDTRSFLAKTRSILAALEDGTRDEAAPNLEENQQATIRALEQAAEDLEAPTQRFEHALHPWVSYFIVPLFALANAGVRFDQGIISVLQSTVALGIVLGLVVGKQIGITLFAWIAVKTGLAAMPAHVTWRQIYGVSWLGGIGFTMSLFITGLAFVPGPLTDLSKTGIYIASIIAGAGGLWILKRNSTLRRKVG
jgi:NhaA family Na+:H+ antiporter